MIRKYSKFLNESASNNLGIDDFDDIKNILNDFKDNPGMRVESWVSLSPGPNRRDQSRKKSNFKLYYTVHLIPSVSNKHMRDIIDTTMDRLNSLFDIEHKEKSFPVMPRFNIFIGEFEYIVVEFTQEEVSLLQGLHNVIMDNIERGLFLEHRDFTTLDIHILENMFPDEQMDLDVDEWYLLNHILKKVDLSILGFDSQEVDVFMRMLHKTYRPLVYGLNT